MFRAMLSLVLLACDVAPSLDSGKAVDSGDTAGAIDSGDSGGVDTADSGDTADTAEPALPFASLGLGVPAYVYPTDPAWDAFVAGVGTSGGFIIMNPNSGPGDGEDSVYAEAVAAARASGVVVLGYVATGYGARDGDDVRREVGRYFAWYGVDGIFFDEVSGPEDCTTSEPIYDSYSKSANEKASSGDAFVVLNPGLVSCEGYLDRADVLVVAEDAGSVLVDWEPAAWMSAYGPERFAILAHDVRSESYEAALQLALDGGAGWVYVTDDTLPNPWDEVPAFWDDQVAATAGE